MLMLTRDQVREKVLREKFVRECVDLDPVLSSAPEACRQSATWRAGLCDAVAEALGAPYRSDKSYFRTPHALQVPDAVRELARRNVKPERFASKAELDADDVAKAKAAERLAAERAARLAAERARAEQRAAHLAEESKCVCGSSAAVACTQRRCGACCKKNPVVHCSRHGTHPPGPRPGHPPALPGSSS